MRWKRSTLFCVFWKATVKVLFKFAGFITTLASLSFVITTSIPSAIAVVACTLSETDTDSLLPSLLTSLKSYASKQQKWSIQHTVHAFHGHDALVKSQLQGKYHQRNQIYKQITAQDVILVDQRGLSSTSLNNVILPCPLGIGGRPFEI